LVPRLTVLKGRKWEETHRNLLLTDGLFVDALDISSEISLCFVEARATAQPVNGFEVCR
jgi:hypothetical protein